jgi:3-oxoacyl-[acyl-carrier protein] reductase
VNAVADAPVAVVTGGARGIGRAIVLDLAGRGYRIAFNHRQSAGEAGQTRERAEALGAECLSQACDVADPASVEAFFAAVEQRFGAVDVLVNNAGITRDALLASQSPQDIHAVLQTNLVGPMLCIQQVLAGMMRRRRGCIVNLSSVAAQRPGKGQAAYAASKGGLEALTRALAVELAPRNIRVNAVAPGLVATGMSESLLGTQGDAIRERLLIKRCAEPDEIAAAVRFLIEDAGYLSGEVLPVNGGLKMA